MRETDIDAEVAEFVALADDLVLDLRALKRFPLAEIQANEQVIRVLIAQIRQISDEFYKLTEYHN